MEYIGGWGSESNREVGFVSFVRACERSCVRLRDDVVPEAGLRKVIKCSVACRAVPSLSWWFVRKSSNHAKSYWEVLRKCLEVLRSVSRLLESR